MWIAVELASGSARGGIRSSYGLLIRVMLLLYMIGGLLVTPSWVRFYKCLRFYSPNMLCLSSSGPDENSYSYHADLSLGVNVVDRFTYVGSARPSPGPALYL